MMISRGIFVTSFWLALSVAVITAYSVERLVVEFVEGLESVCRTRQEGHESRVQYCTYDTERLGTVRVLCIVCTT
jgi:hypothetical protein